MAKDTKAEKNKLRRYLGDVYIRGETSQLLGNMRDTDHKDILDELPAGVWERPVSQQPVTDLERGKYKKEARQLLRHIEHKKRTWFRRVMTTAASVAAIIAIVTRDIGYFRYMSERQITFVEISTSFGEKKQVELPDGTMLVLNSCSQTRYPNFFQGDIRKVELEGERYFRVTHDEDMPFVVQARRLDVRVLGTRFSVKSYSTNEIVSVSVESGKVQVDLSGAMIRLTTKEQVLINTVSGKYSRKREEHGVAVWIKKSLRFNSTPIWDVAKKLERIYNCQIIFASGQELDNLITGEHDNKSPESILKSIKSISDINYKREGRNILLYKK